ncbi:hypothetical protein [Companilactobacillus sp. DQM5]|uniref:hypothetical protein n=1 Tax=Companilactobacillus sp. DQM5 TaxID=3463359 RepID=UPI004059A98A
MKKYIMRMENKVVNTFKRMLSERFILINKILILELLIITISSLIGLITSGTWRLDSSERGISISLIVWLPLFFSLYPIIIGTNMIRQFGFSRYRLIAISDTKLYLSSIFASFINWMYIFMVQIGLAAGAMIIFFKNHEHLYIQIIQSLKNSSNVPDVKNIIFSIILVCLSIFTIILLVNSGVFLGKIVSSILPIKISTLIKVIIYIIMIFLVLLITNKIESFITDSNNYINMLMTVIEAVIVISINQYLLKYYEASK